AFRTRNRSRYLFGRSGGLLSFLAPGLDRPHARGDVAQGLVVVQRQLGASREAADPQGTPDLDLGSRCDLRTLAHDHAPEVGRVPEVDGVRVPVGHVDLEV